MTDFDKTKSQTGQSETVLSRRNTNMPEMPNVQREILEFALEQADGPYDAVDLREFAAQSDYTETKVAEKAADTGVLEAGVSIMVPWYTDKQEVKDRLEEISK